MERGFYYVQPLTYRWYHRKKRRLYTCCICTCVIGPGDLHAHSIFHMRHDEDLPRPLNLPNSTLCVVVRRLANNPRNPITKPQYVAEYR